MLWFTNYLSLNAHLIFSWENKYEKFEWVIIYLNSSRNKNDGLAKNALWVVDYCGATCLSNTKFTKLMWCKTFRSNNNRSFLVNTLTLTNPDNWWASLSASLSLSSYSIVSSHCIKNVCLSQNLDTVWPRFFNFILIIFF